MNLSPADIDYLPLAGVPLPGQWARQAACRGLDPDIFFPERGRSDDLQAARAVCLRCPVRDECLEYALRHHIRCGVWGNTSERERRGMRAARRRAVA